MQLRTRRARRRPEINIIPLIDVLVVLLFFFLVSMQFRDRSVLEIDLPEITTAGQQEVTRPIEIAISAQGQLYLNGLLVDEDTLTQRLEVLGRAGSDRPVLIVADRESFLGFLTFVMDSCRKAGLTQVRIQSRS